MSCRSTGKSRRDDQRRPPKTGDRDGRARDLAQKRRATGVTTGAYPGSSGDDARGSARPWLDIAAIQKPLESQRVTRAVHRRTKEEGTWPTDTPSAISPSYASSKPTSRDCLSGRTGQQSAPY